MELPSFKNLINDSTKMKYLEKLLQEKHQLGERVLIFC
jgi:SNF2 family DNA or RNA helicase